MSTVETRRLFDPQNIPWDSLSPPKTPMRKNIRDFVRRCAQESVLDTPIIDVACGYRNNYPEIALGTEEKAPFYLAFDHTSEFDQIEQGLGPNLIADASAIPLADSCAGTVVCTEVLEHVENDSLVIVEMSRILRPGGLLILTVPGKDVPKHEKLPHQLDYRRYTLSNLGELLKQNMFTEIKLTDCYDEGRQINILVSAIKGVA